ncbi:hypothetical protein SteCoe_17156 [Stentor coeruleus]|uniref:Uncharacterized protein n=1 Tax=Stentor coeruleus TaxID=5963 RepID=A0A1R2BZP3_9CILI|nr:hypothetical protein SteCoe_17156 [Stentor coeruleus]
MLYYSFQNENVWAKPFNTKEDKDLVLLIGLQGSYGAELSINSKLKVLNSYGIILVPAPLDMHKAKVLENSIILCNDQNSLRIISSKTAEGNILEIHDESLESIGISNSGYFPRYSKENYHLETVFISKTARKIVLIDNSAKRPSSVIIRDLKEKSEMSFAIENPNRDMNQNNEILCEFKSKKSAFFTCAILSSDENFMFCALNICRIYKVSLKSHKKDMNFAEGHNDIISILNASDDNNYLISSSYDLTIIVWDFEQLIKKFTLTGHQGIINDVVIGKKNKELYCGSCDRKLWGWNIESGNSVFNLRGNCLAITCLDLSENEMMLASGTCDFSVEIWNLVTHEIITTFVGHSFPIKTCKFFNFDQHLFTSSSDNFLLIWSLKTFSIIYKILSTAYTVSKILEDPNQRYLGVIYTSGNTHFWDKLNKNLYEISDNYVNDKNLQGFLINNFYICALDNNRIKVIDFVNNKSIMIIRFNKRVTLMQLIRREEYSLFMCRNRIYYTIKIDALTYKYKENLQLEQDVDSLPFSKFTNKFRLLCLFKKRIHLR